MKRPWQVWSLFLLCLAVVLPAMAWLTVQALELDREVARAAQQADLEEDISLALWRMDVALAPMVAQEAARPYLVYRPFLTNPLETGGKGTTDAKASPLLNQPSQFVRLHFQLAQDGSITSPQCPSGTLRELAVHAGANLDNIDLSCDRLAMLSEKVRHDQLLAVLPTQTLPPIEVGQELWNSQATLGDRALNNVQDNWQVLVQNDAQLQDFYENPPAQQTEDQQTGLPQPNLDDQQTAPQPQQGANANDANRQPTANAQGQAPPGKRWADQYKGNAYGYARGQRDQLMRGNLEYQRRNKALQSIATSEVRQQRFSLPVEAATHLVSEGVSAPIWLDDELLLARRVTIDDKLVVQGCWFDWPRLKEFLIAEGLGVQDSPALPEFDLVPIHGDSLISPARRLATLPVEIVVPSPDVQAAPLSPIRLSLLIAWACMFLAGGAVAILLKGVVTLSERRGAFVSAVTHELRTPLTTFRVYAEMLDEGMVTDPDKQSQYTKTLRVESDRLAHLVENVLAYARLERGRRGGRRQSVALGAMVDRISDRLTDRARGAEMDLVVEGDAQARQCKVMTDPAAVEQILFNLVDNACKYAAAANNRQIRLGINTSGRKAEIRVQDHGPGISYHFRKSLFQPFSKSVEDAAVTAPGVGLGLALCRRLAQELGGSLELEQSDREGATFVLTLPLT